MSRPSEVRRVLEDVSQQQREAGPGVAPQFHDIVAIGASAGAVEALTALIGALPADFPGSLFVVVHVSPDTRSKLGEILGRTGLLPVVTPEDMAPIVPGRVYVSSPDRHLLIEHDRVRVVRGPRENRHRPAIDPMFRSAAWAFGPRVVGVIMTGSGDDGTAGLWAIKSCGGITIVQDPATAQHAGMPQSALAQNDVDHCVPLGQIAPLITRLAHEPLNGRNCDREQRKHLKTEVEFDTMRRDISDMGTLGKLSPFTCPSCRGALWELQDGGILRYRCHTGHAFSENSLRAEQSNAVEEGLYSALRAVEEKSAFMRRLGSRWQEQHPKLVEDYEAKAEELEQSAEVLRELLSRGTV